ncbi:MAG: M15 family metallopeptidase [Solobacterium sp.]|nr:M15 family metallopeptidase [Solobacterium sp.]
MTMKYGPIPSPVQTEEKEPVFRDSPLVEIREDSRLKLHMMYPALGLKNGYRRCLLRKEAAEMLEQAKKYLPEGYSFLIWDAWRPFALQKELREYYRGRIIEEFGLMDKSKEEREQFISRFVADPVPDRIHPPAHTTGGAVDLTIAGPDGTELDMGTAFDAFTERTETVWYEQQESNEEIRENRRLLYQIMTRAGFTNIPSEWWHYEYGDRNWSSSTGEPPCYSGIFTVEEAEQSTLS